METQTKTPTAARAPSDRTLGLGAVLAGSLPRGLGTPDAPPRYTVEAVFTRRPERREVERIVGDDTRTMLRRAGYTDVALAVSDRRLEIRGTSLEELRDGLSTLIADRLVEIGDETRAEEDAASLRSHDAAEHERTRLEQVAALAASVTFRAGGRPATHADAPAANDDPRTESWTNEGGHGRSERP